MFSRHVSGQLAAYLDGELTPRDAQWVERHLADCPNCRLQQEQIRRGMSALDLIPTAHAPDAIWASIESAIPSPRVPSTGFFHWWKPSLAVMAILAAVVAVRLLSRGTKGDWIETGAASTAHFQIANIGSVDVEPNTRLRIVADRPNEHRLSLKRGEIHAKIFAPPKLFFVDTASATAEDLGCEYSLKTDEDGSGVLHVTLGWVSFQWQGHESLVPAGASCRTYPHIGPGVPYFDDAPQALTDALRTNSLDDILANARVRDTLTLWHLLSRVGVNDRQRVYDRIAALTPVPPDILREKALTLDPDTLARWKDSLAWIW
jgi:hypothetical protein